MDSLPLRNPPCKFSLFRFFLLCSFLPRCWWWRRRRGCSLLWLQLSSCKKDDFGCGFGARVMWHHFVLRIYMSFSKPKASSSLRQEEEEDDHEQKTSGESLSRFCCPVSAYHENLLQLQLFLLLLELFLFYFSSKRRWCCSDFFVISIFFVSSCVLFAFVLCCSSEDCLFLCSLTISFACCVCVCSQWPHHCQILCCIFCILFFQRLYPDLSRISNSSVCGIHQLQIWKIPHQADVNLELLLFFPLAKLSLSAFCWGCFAILECIL